jgi:saccharopine dehydrogenase-like NADP-dependent oxidoreductase
MKIGIVGAGQVGATAAYSMMMRRVGSGILPVDRDADLAVAQASLPILMARAWSCLLRGLTRGRGRAG